MTIQIVNTGTSANSGNGDSIRNAFTKINNNFQELTVNVDTIDNNFQELTDRVDTIDNNFQELSDIVGTIDKIEDVVGSLLSASTSNGMTITYDISTNELDFSLQPATTSSIGGIIVDSGLSVATDGKLSANFGDIVITNNSITTKFADEDIILQPTGSAGTAKIRIINHALQFDNGAGDAYTGHLIYTNPLSVAGIGIGESNHSIRIAGDTVTLGLIADFGLYNAIRGTWNSLITVDYTGNMSMNDGDLIFNTNNKGIQFHDGSKQTTAFIEDTVVAKSTGTWAVTTGTNTYSITVPENGVYHLWINGNIPNGVITYSATVNVTDSTVPVLGSHRAYNYTDGGSPILLTSIPSQIIGVEGTISTATVSGTTNNIFEFEISNTSESAQTVSWGYTTLS